MAHQPRGAVMPPKQPKARRIPRNSQIRNQNCPKTGAQCPWARSLLSVGVGAIQGRWAAGQKAAASGRGKGLEAPDELSRHLTLDLTLDLALDLALLSPWEGPQQRLWFQKVCAEPLGRLA